MVAVNVDANTLSSLVGCFPGLKRNGGLFRLRLRTSHARLCLICILIPCSRVRHSPIVGTQNPEGQARAE